MNKGSFKSNIFHFVKDCENNTFKYNATYCDTLTNTKTYQEIFVKSNNRSPHVYHSREHYELINCHGDKCRQDDIVGVFCEACNGHPSDRPELFIKQQILLAMLPQDEIKDFLIETSAIDMNDISDVQLLLTSLKDEQQVYTKLVKRRIELAMQLADVEQRLTNLDDNKKNNGNDKIKYLESLMQTLKLKEKAGF